MRINYTQQQLCDSIYKLLTTSGDKWLTRKEICEGIERKKSPHVIKMIEHLVSSGYVEKVSQPMAQGFDVFFYRGIVREGACTDAA